MSDSLWIGNDNLIAWRGAVNEATGESLNAATCRFSVYDALGTALAQNVSMSHVPDSDGDYVGTLQSTVALLPDRYYYVEITLVQGDLVGFFRLRAVAVYRD